MKDQSLNVDQYVPYYFRKDACEACYRPTTQPENSSQPVGKSML